MKIAIPVSSVGYHWEELVAAYKQFKKNGFEVDLFTPTGTPAIPDPLSLAKTGPLAAFGIGTPRCISPQSEIGKEVLSKLVKVRAVSQMNTSEYAAIYVPGGHGCLQDINTNAELHKKISEFHAAGKILGAVCHATSTFAMVKQNGVSITSNKRMTGFPDLLDSGLIKAGLVPKQFLPLPLSNDQTLKQSGAKLSLINQMIAVLWPKYYRVDLPFVTGTGPKAAGIVAKIMSKVISKH